MIVLGGRLLEPENKRVCQTSALETGDGCNIRLLRNVSSGCL